MLRAVQRVRQRRPLVHAGCRRGNPPAAAVVRGGGVGRDDLVARRGAGVAVVVAGLATARRDGAPAAGEAQPGQPDSHRGGRGGASARRAAVARRPAPAGARRHGAAQPVDLRREQGDHRGGRRDTAARPRAQVGRVAGRAGERGVRAAPPVPARRLRRGLHRPRGRHPAAGLPPRDRRRARQEGRRYGPLRALQRRAREPPPRRGGRCRAPTARPHGRPGDRHGGQGRLRLALPRRHRRGPLRRRRGRRHPRPRRDGGGRLPAAEGDRHPLPPTDLRGQRCLPHHGRPRGRHPSPRRPLPILLRPPQAQNQGGGADRDATAATEREPAREANGGRCGGVILTSFNSSPQLGGAPGVVLCFPYSGGDRGRRRPPARACKYTNQRVCVRERVYIFLKRDDDEGDGGAKKSLL
uniref:Uncharacterized protein n=1 Tax=Oryza nivara TaxID=4536 RepID=A0A0E0I301_ORYNI